MATYPPDPSTACTDCGRYGAHECQPRVTLGEFTTDEDWPTGAAGFRVPGGRVTWSCVRWPEGGNGARIEVSRIVHEDGQAFTRAAYYNPNTPMIFVGEDGEPLERARRAEVR